MAGETNSWNGGPRHYGWFRGDTPHTFAANVIWVCVIFGWTMGMMYPFFWVLNKFGKLRISREEEMVSYFTACVSEHRHPANDPFFCNLKFVWQASHLPEGSKQVSGFLACQGSNGMQDRLANPALTSRFGVTRCSLSLVIIHTCSS